MTNQIIFEIKIPSIINLRPIDEQFERVVWMFEKGPFTESKNYWNDKAGGTNTNNMMHLNIFY